MYIPTDTLHQRVVDGQCVVVDVTDGIELPGGQHDESHGVCHEHYYEHRAVDLSAFTVEHDGVEYAPRESVHISICPRCARDRRDPGTSRQEYVKSQLQQRDDWWRIFGRFFEPLLPDGFDVPLVACPNCGEGLDETELRAADHVDVTCSQCGDYTIHLYRDDD